MKSCEQTESRPGSEACFLVAASGYGTRLRPLTADKAKPSLAVSFNREGAIERMIDIPLNAVRELGGYAIVTSFYAPESLDFVKEYPQTEVASNEPCLSYVDTLAKLLKNDEFLEVKTVGIVPGDTLISPSQLQDLYEAHQNFGANATILATQTLADHYVRPVDKHGMMVAAELSTDRIADLGVHLIDREWLTSRIGSVASEIVNTDLWKDIYNVADPPEGIMLHVPTQDNGWVDMGTPSAFYKTVMTRNETRADCNNNIIFPGASLCNNSSETIALPKSRSTHPHTRAILPEDASNPTGESILKI